MLVTKKAPDFTATAVLGVTTVNGNYCTVGVI